MQQHGEETNDPVYFSRITQQWEPLWFYASMLKKLGSFAQAIDRCATASRELVWSHIFYLYNQPNRKCSDLFSPIIDEWCHSQSMDLSAIEIMYTSFLQIYNQYPGLFEDVLTPGAAPMGDTSPFSYSVPFGDKSEFKKEDNKVKTIKLANTALIWGSSFASSIQQFSLLLIWATLLEKLPPNQKEAIWNTCQFFPLFSSDSFDRASFRKTFLKWAGNLPSYMSHITILFGAIGFLRDKGIIKHQFFYPNTTMPVFNSGVKSQPPSSQYLTPPAHSHFSPSSPQSPGHATPHTPTSRPSSPAFPGSSSSEFLQASPPPLHHFYSAGHPSHSPHPAHPGAQVHPVLPTLDGTTRGKPLPFESLSLPPLSIPSSSSSSSVSPLPIPSLQSSSNSSTILPPPSSRLGLLALAAFQADDTDAPPTTSSSISKILDQSSSSFHPALKAMKQDPSPSTPSTKPQGIPKQEESVEIFRSQPQQPPQQPQNPTTSSFLEKSMKHEPLVAPTMKISKRKNSSCSEYHEDEVKRPRTMNLSHILCS